MKLVLDEQWQIVGSNVVTSTLFSLGGLILIFIAFATYKRLIGTVNLQNENHVRKPWLRWLLVCVANISVFLLLFLLIFELEISSQGKVSAVVITQGTPEQQYSEITAFDKTDIYFYRISEANRSSSEFSSNFDKLNKKHNIHFIDTAVDLRNISNKYSRIDLFGDGLLIDELEHLTTFRELPSGHLKDNEGDSSRLVLNVHPSEKRTGLIFPEWQKRLLPGEKLSLRGQFQHTNNKDIFDLVLSDHFDHELQRMKVKAGERFNFTSAVKMNGNFVYHLKLFYKQQLISSEPVAFSVLDSSKANILIKQSAPSYENNHLKNWAAEQGSFVLVQTQISSQNFITQHVNMPEGYLETISEKQDQVGKNFQYFDLLIIDGKSLLALSENELIALNTAVQTGLGLLIQVDVELSKWFINEIETNVANIGLTNLLNDFSLLANEALTNNRLTQVLWQESTSKQPLHYYQGQLTVKNGSSIAISDSKQALVAKKLIGQGVVAMSLLKTTYKWKTSAELSDYSQFWQTIISETARKAKESYWLPVPDSANFFTQQRALVCGQNISNGVHSKEVALVSMLDSNRVGCGNLLMNNQGWQTINLKSADNKQLDSLNIYTLADQNWNVWQQYRKHLVSSEIKKRHTIEQSKKVYYPADKFTLWSLLLLSFTFLWLERKAFYR